MIVILLEEATFIAIDNTSGFLELLTRLGIYSFIFTALIYRLGGLFDFKTRSQVFEDLDKGC